MNEITSSLLSTILQLIVFTLIPFLAYQFFYKNKKGFFEYIGLKKTPLKPLLISTIFAVINLVFAYVAINYNEEMASVLSDEESMSGRMRALGPGFQTFLIICMAALFKTALAEEILFRGFIAKRLIALTGFQTGNIIQSVLFGVIHFLLFLTLTRDTFILVWIFVSPALMAYVVVYLNEKMANGSILPGWVGHALGNFATYSVFAFA